ncbi:unnamed protein product [Adineta ricciae]|uniref:SCP domain-containing protein n=1 Tax=Adineta ricciae TaxID=249248 RepID=A0A815G6I7_ADIRI|nr:unnamed protein product [Adineta ricciae]
MIDQQHSYCLNKRSLYSLPPTESEIKEILKLHNQERIDVQGENMQQMYWSRDLAEIAQRYAEHCVFDHDKSIQREAPRIPMPTGQNLALGHNSWNQAIRGWANEKKDFNYGSQVQNGPVGHYTQMVKDTAALVGCGVAMCPKGQYNSYHDWLHHVCNCNGLVCLYGGTIDLNSCECRCTSYASGKQCEKLDCASLPNTCPYGSDRSWCIKYANVPAECPKFCGLCDRYEEMKKYYSTLEIQTDIGIGEVDIALSVRSVTRISISYVFIQIIIVRRLIK